MVAEYSAGHLTRSLVRIPNSRVDRIATAVMVDLSRVSPLAAAVPISLSIPSGLQHQSSSYVPVNAKGHAAAAPTASGPPPRLSGIQAAVVTASGSSPRARASGGQAAAATAPSRKRATTKNPNTVARSGKRSRPGVPQQVNTASAGVEPPTKKTKVVQKLPGQASVRTSLPNHRTSQVPATSVRNTRSQPPSGMVTAHNHLRQPTLVMTPHQLLQERDQLKHENLALKQQLSLFHMLFRNKEKLKSVVRTLGIEVH